MRIMERHIAQVRPDKWQELDRVEAKYDAIERDLGFPAKRRYRALYGGYARNVYVTEREWNGMAEMEAALEKGVANADWLALGQELNAVIESLQIEIYQIL